MSVVSNILAGLGQVVSFFIEETQVARYLTVAESVNGFTVPDPNAPLPVSDRHIQDIDAPGVIGDLMTVIVFRTKHTGSPSFSVRLNATRLIQQTLTTEGPHTWHEVVPAGALRETGNELTFAVGTGEGSVTFSDVVILYTSNKLTVRKPRPVVVSPGG